MAKILISNVPHDIDEAELIRWLELSGRSIKKVRLIRDEVSRSSSSFAHVEVEDDTVRDLVRHLNGQVLRSRPITATANSLRV